MKKHTHTKKYKTPKEAIEAVAHEGSGVSAGLTGDETVKYVADGRGGVIRVVHFCNSGMGGYSKITHRERRVRGGQR